MPVPDVPRSVFIADAALREALERFVRAKVPASEVEDIVQSTLTDALAAPRAPETDEDLRRWVYGIARHKVADHYRREARAAGCDGCDPSDAPAEPAPHSATDLLRWAERELPQGGSSEDTLEWMLREGDGEKLEHIAAEQQVAPTKIRQRVSRLRRYFRERWAQQLAAVAAIVILVVTGLLIWSNRVDRQPEIVREGPSALPPLDERVGELRERALEHCEAERWKECLEGLDEAGRLDPAGNRRDEVQRARRRAEEALSLPPPSAPSSQPSSSAVPEPPRPSLPKSPKTTMDPSGAF